MFGRTKREIQIHEEYEEDLWPVEVDQGQIQQVLLNLYVNASHAMPSGATYTSEPKTSPLRQMKPRLLTLLQEDTSRFP
ncbi:MAG: hypothetical protein U5R49_04110 [Deltaproteobacteria bacterium]|nr:hypothetical protein [Deltaproteobacteria bacterium]